jgi:rhamnogalacturonan endolyase
VNWTGDGTHLLLLSAAPGPEGGLYDGFGRQALAFPDDGHPVLCSDALDITGNELDDIVCWDHDNLWIYSREDTPAPASVKKMPFYPPRYNTSNYRAVITIGSIHDY